MDVSRAIEYILSDELEQSKQNTSKWVLSSFKHFTRSKSQRKKGSERSPSRNSSTGAIDDDEEEQLRLAVEMSLQPQSSDVIFPEDAPKAPPPSVSPPRSNSPYFGPARATEYNESQWGMVLSDQSVQEQETGLVDAQGNTYSSTPRIEQEKVEDPAQRIRREQLPTVLDPRRTTQTLGSDHISWLASLLTILHKIPKVREAFILGSPREGADQTPEDKWWNGARIMDSETDDEDSTGLGILRETGRTMAFLDHTERAYGK